MYGTSRKKLAATHFCARRSAVSKNRFRPLKRTMTISAAAPSTADPIAQAMTPMEFASAPRMRPPTPSASIQMRLNHASRRA
jgi:hypothetical protein